METIKNVSQSPGRSASDDCVDNVGANTDATKFHAGKGSSRFEGCKGIVDSIGSFSVVGSFLLLQGGESSP